MFDTQRRVDKGLLQPNIDQFIPYFLFMFLSELDIGTQELLGVGVPEGVHRVKTVRTPNDITCIGQEGVSRLLGNRQVTAALKQP